MATQISGSVGQGGKNLRADVQAVQELLNRVKAGQGGPEMPVATDGLSGPETVGAIARFQKLNFGWSDGRVDANGQTLARMNGIADGLPVSAPTVSIGSKSSSSDPAGVIDGAAPGSGKGAKTPPADDSVRVVMVVGVALCNNPNWHGGVYPGLVLKPEGILWTVDDDSLVMLEYLPSHRFVQVPGSTTITLGFAKPLPPAPYTKNNSKAAPYYQAGNKSPLSKPTPWNVAEGPCKPPAQYYRVP